MRCYLSIDGMQKFDIKLILLTLSPVAGEQELVVLHADVRLLAVHDLHREEDEPLSLVPAAVGSQGSTQRSPRIKTFHPSPSAYLCLDKYGHSDPWDNVPVISWYGRCCATEG